MPRGTRRKEKLEELQEAKRVHAQECLHELAEIACTAYRTKSCSRCHENEMALVSISPNAKSIQYACTYCGMRRYAEAGGLFAEKIKGLERFIVAEYGGGWSKTLKGDCRCTFSVPATPHQSTSREHIPQAMREAVWDRDGGKCMQCGGKKYLQYDHIIPASKGGATTVENLQVLCQSCNLSKGAKI